MKTVNQKRQKERTNSAAITLSTSNIIPSITPSILSLNYILATKKIF